MKRIFPCHGDLTVSVTIRMCASETNYRYAKVNEAETRNFQFGISTLVTGDELLQLNYPYCSYDWLDMISSAACEGSLMI